MEGDYLKKCQPQIAGDDLMKVGRSALAGVGSCL